MGLAIDVQPNSPHSFRPTLVSWPGRVAELDFIAAAKGLGEFTPPGAFSIYGRYCNGDRLAEMICSKR
jgi:hypothetical protein